MFLIATPVAGEVSPSTLDIEENQPREPEAEGENEEGDEEVEESAPVSGRGQRGVPRRAARRARGRARGGATRARVVSTRLHGGRRNVALPTTNSAEDNNITLEETLTTETEESPKKPTSKVTTPVVEQKSVPTTPATPVDETQPSSQPTSGSNIRVSGMKILFFVT